MGPMSQQILVFVERKVRALGQLVAFVDQPFVDQPFVGRPCVDQLFVGRPFVGQRVPLLGCNCSTLGLPRFGKATGRMQRTRCSFLGTRGGRRNRFVCVPAIHCHR